jgi:hypothetical protein
MIVKFTITCNHPCKFALNSLNQLLIQSPVVGDGLLQITVTYCAVAV